MDAGEPHVSEDRIAALHEENALLEQRVLDLELLLSEYRRQTDGILTSTSWRVTSPLRTMRRRARDARARLRRSRRRTDRRMVGLFPPPASSLPEGSPLRRPHAPSPFEGIVGQSGRGPEGPRIVVVAHVHYPELWMDVEDRFARMPEPFDLIVTVTSGAAESVIPTIMQRQPSARIVTVYGSGRDWGPFVDVVNAGMLSGYEAVLKVHTKKSAHRVDGDGWRQELLDNVMESPAAISRILALLETDPETGIVAPARHIHGSENWGSNLPGAELLASRLPLEFDPEELKFPGGSMFWCRPWLVEQLAALNLRGSDFEPEAGQYDGTTAHVLERLVGVLAVSAGMAVVPTSGVTARLRAARERAARPGPGVLAFYLPQYHRIAENDTWWGAGFTDWVNVDKARALFDGHRQPLLPAGLGHYDLSDPEVMRAQAALARENGVAGFVFHHYWFDGHPLLDTPLSNLLADPTIPMPFALSWANEPWTRRWDGLANDVLIQHRYLDGWADDFYAGIRGALNDPRHLRVDGRPLLMLYRIDLIPSGRAAVERLAELAREDGHPGLHVLGVLPSRDFGDIPGDAARWVDGLVTFPPGSGVALRAVTSRCPDLEPGFTGEVFSYATAAAEPGPVPPVPSDVPVYPGVMPGWDNTARRGSAAYVFHGSNPLLFRRWLARGIDEAREASVPFVFVNAWNEWAEGAHLEPDAVFGPSWLEAVADVQSQQAQWM